MGTYQRSANFHDKIACFEAADDFDPPPVQCSEQNRGALSTVSVIELEHGVWRAKDAAQADRRRRFFDDLFGDVAIYPLTFDIARHAAKIDGESRRRGVVIPFQDLVIGVTALEFGYAVATANVRHFRMIPNLVVREI